MKKILIITLLTLVPLLGYSQEVAPEKPDGYFSNLTLKISYALGRLKLIETDFPLPESIKEYKDITYKTIENTNLKLDIYHQKKISEATPLIIFIHGGAWKKGDKHDYWPYLIPYAEKGVYHCYNSISFNWRGNLSCSTQRCDIGDSMVTRKCK